MAFKRAIIEKTSFMIIGVISFYLLFHFHILIHNSDVYGTFDEIPQLIDPNLKVEEVIDGLEMPTSMAFLGPSDILVLEKNGTVLRITNGTILDDPVLQVPVSNGFYQGLLGIAIMKNTTTSDTNVYLYYTESQKSKQKNNSKTTTNNTLTIGNRLYSYELVINNELIL